MSVEETIIQQLREFRKWQMEEQEKLLQQQKEQIENLSDEHNRMCQVLSMSMDEASMDEQSIKNLVDIQGVKEENLINLDEDCVSPKIEEPALAEIISQGNENNNNNIFDLEIPKMKLGVKNSDYEPNSNLNYLYDQLNSSSDLSKNELQSYFSDQSGRSNIQIDEIPLPVPKEDFETLLEKKLRDSDEISIQVTPKPIVKKPFLRKGEGLARFKPNIKHQDIPKCTLKSRRSSICSSQSSNRCKTPNSDRSSISSKTKINDKRKSLSSIPPVAQEKLILKNVPLPKKKIHSRSMEPVSNLISEQKKKTSVSTPDQSSSDLETKNKREQEEVRIFELLEDKAENSSFCSTSSTVIAFLQQSTPLKHKALLHSAYKNKISFNDVGDQTLEEIVASTKSNQLPLSEVNENSSNQKLSQWDSLPVSKIKNDKIDNQILLPYGTDLDTDYENYNPNCNTDNDENDVSLHVRFAEQNEYKNITDNSSISSDSQTIMKYADDKGAWSDCSATDSSDTENVLLFQLKKQLKNFEALDFLRKNVGSNYDDEIDDHTEDNEENEKEKEIDSEVENDPKNITLTMDDDHNCKNDTMSFIKSELLKTRLEELEQEIEIFRKENAGLTFQRQKLQEERTKLQEERISLQRSFKEKEEALELEKKKAKNSLQEERKRLNQEKSALENRLKDAYEKSQKSKQERQEIQTLKDQLDELKEEYRQSESKWTAINARQRSQMRVLQTENSKLKQEVEKLQQQKNAKFKKVISSNTKAIHQINKALANRKKTSPFKNEEILFENDDKQPELHELINQIDLNTVHTPEENEKDQQAEKLKIVKSAESIARTRNLYESLLRDALEDFPDIRIEKKILSNQIGESLDKDKNVNGNEEEHNNLSNKEKNLESPGEKSDGLKDEKNNKNYREVHHPDGHIEHWYPNGNVKKIFPDEELTKIIYYNGDVRVTDKDGIVKYYYASSRTWHTTMPDGSEILKFPDGQIEKKSKDGTIEVIFTDGSVKVVCIDGSEKWILNDGTIAETSADGDRTLIFPNGQREIHTKESKRREYPDGTIKFVYPDGLQETRYANGRVRLKDKHGNLIMDSFQQ